MATYAADSEIDFSHGMTVATIINISATGERRRKVIFEFGSFSPDFRMTVQLDDFDGLYLSVTSNHEEIFRTSPVNKTFFCGAYHSLILKIYRSNETSLIGEVFIDGIKRSYSEATLAEIPPMKSVRGSVGGTLEAELPGTFEISTNSVWTEAPMAEEIHNAILAEQTERLSEVSSKQRGWFLPSNEMAKAVKPERDHDASK